MEEYMVAEFIMTFIIFLIFLGFLVWGIRTGQFTDVEAPKYRIFEEPEVSEKEDKKV
ncbi:MAG: cbb3-type cytochrome oxidase assembly protein [Candidatus Methanoperedens sp.]|nr:cbb3-type cytochrome oxidase assembly protein [Candidatus Methanoperedens sp.]